MARIVLGNSSLAGYPEGGGHWMLFLQYLLGLDALGHDVFWLELFSPTKEPDRDRQTIAAFFERMAGYGFKDCCAILFNESSAKSPAFESCAVLGRSQLEVRDIVRDADLFWNLCGSFEQPLLGMFHRPVLVDLDPGVLQVSALQHGVWFADHAAFLTVGYKLHDPDCEVPTLGLKWHRFLPFVHLPLWRLAADPGINAPFTTITQWNWSELWLENRVLSIAKRDAYLNYLELPARARRPFELAANIHPDDQTGDRELLLSNGWRLADPHAVCGSPEAYQAYIARSRGEISCPKPIYRELNTGWISDRSVCYLASGRPVLAEDTGFSNFLPAREGLVVFRNLDEAMAGVANIDANYARHSHAARELAENYFDARQCLPKMLAACG